MSPLIPDLLFLAGGFVLLVKGADWLVKGSASLALKLGISQIVIGLTIVAFGTSAPELVVNTIGAFKGLNDIVLGNVLGSNIFNTLIILGVTAMIRPVTIGVKTIRREIPYSILAGVVLLVLANDHFFAPIPAIITRIDSGILLGFFLLFLYMIFQNIRDDKTLDVPFTGNQKNGLLVLLIVAGFGGLILGGKFVVDSAVSIATHFGVSERIIGLTIMAVGTSLPELATSVVAAWRGNSDLAIGNVVGSNIFNLLFILSISGLINPIAFSPSFNPDILLYILASFMVLGAMVTGRKRMLDRWEGMIFVVIYIAYTYYLIKLS
jgi:cation:H+ antiporter